MFELKGNYFNSEYVQPTTSGPYATEVFIERECPSNTDLKLWTLPVEYTNLDVIVDSAVEGFKVWRNTEVSERIEFFQKYKEALTKRKDEIANAIALEVG